MKKIIPILILIQLTVFFFPPSIRAKDVDESAVPSTAIILLKHPLSKEEIGKLVKRYPNLQLDHIYENIFSGFSVTGPDSQIKKLESEEMVFRAFPSVTHQLQYEVIPFAEIPQNDSFPSYIYTDSSRLRTAQTAEQTEQPLQWGPPTKTGLVRKANEEEITPVQKGETDSPLSYRHKEAETIRPHSLHEGPAPIFFHAFKNEPIIRPHPYDSLKKPTSIQFIGTDEVRNKTDSKGNKLTGKGIKVGIIDTGIDYSHPDLRANYEKGYDFVEKDDDPMEREGETFHGTHVAGIIAANGKMTGMAPEAKLYVYRALGPGGIGTTEHILAAIEQAMKDKVDVLNLSLGIQINGPDLPTSLALDAAVKRGMIAVASNGNAGPDLWTVGSPGTSAKAISVGASTPKLSVPYLEYKQNLFRLKPLREFSKWDYHRSYPLIYEREGISAKVKKVKDAIVLLEKGAFHLSDKIEKLAHEGAKGILLTGFSEEDLQKLLEETNSAFPVPVSILSKEEGEKLIKQTEPGSLTRLVHKEEEDVLANFSSRGPVTSTWNIKPDLLAPGVAITSTVPGGYLTLNGTSMAAPHVAGACALLKQAHPDWTPEQMKAVLMNTSKPLGEVGKHYETFEQGAGRIQVDEALRSNSIIRPGALRFGKTNGKTFDEKTRFLTVENISGQPVRYTFSQPARGENILWDFPAPFYLNPGEKRNIQLTMRLKNTHKAHEMYNGYLQMNANDQTFHIPYLYVVKEPNYPRILLFAIGEGKRKGTLQCEIYLPGGADEFGIMLFEPDTGQLVRLIKRESKVRRGLSVKEIYVEKNLPAGTYLAVAYAKKDGRENYLEQLVEIRKGEDSYHDFSDK